MHENITSKIKMAPNNFGVYRFMDANKKILYVGKASNLSKRLKNYLSKNVPTKTQRMLFLATDVDWTICKNEEHALLTEAFQVKEFQPRYNILLKDDKSFLQICIPQHKDFPNIYVERSRNRKVPSIKTKNTKESIVRFGPFVYGGIIKTAIDAMQKLFLVRDCRDSVFGVHKKQNRPCLQYHIKRCSGPCAGYISEKEYQKNVQQCINLLNGDSKDVLKDMKKQMAESSSNMEYEKAATIRDRISIINEIAANEKSESVFISSDFITITIKDNICCFYVTFFRNYKNCGNIDLFTKNIEELQGEDNFIVSLILQFYENKTPPKNIIINQKIDQKSTNIIKKALKLINGEKVDVRNPKTKKEKDVLRHSEIQSTVAVQKKSNASNSVESILTSIKEKLKLPSFPKRIEVFDNSHLFGTDRVGAMIVANTEGFIKRDYQTFVFKNASSNSADDYAMMKEMIKQRLEQIKNITSREKQKAPDLLMIDGGRGHKTVVMEAMEEVGIFLPFVCIAKGIERNAGRETFFTAKEDDVQIEFQSPEIFYLQNLRDEAHRFAITSHRRKKISRTTESELDKIEGIGEGRKAKLLSHFGSTEEIKRASIQSLMKVDGISQKTAERIYWHFKR